MSVANLKGKENIFSKRLKKLMNNNNVTQEMLADILEVKRQTISLYVNGSSLPPLEKFLEIANYFDVSTDYLLGKTEVTTVDISIQQICACTHLSEDSIKVLLKYQKFKETETNTLNSLLKKTSDNKNKRKKTDSTFEEDLNIKKHQINILMSEQFQEFLNLFIVYPEAAILANKFFEAIENGVKFCQYDIKEPRLIEDENFLDYMEKSELEEYRYQKACMKMLEKVRNDVIAETNNN